MLVVGFDFSSKNTESTTDVVANFVGFYLSFYVYISEFRSTSAKEIVQIPESINIFPSLIVNEPVIKLSTNILWAWLSLTLDWKQRQGLRSRIQQRFMTN